MLDFRFGRCLGLVLLALALMPRFAPADLITIHDSGETRPLAPLLKVFAESEASTESAPPPGAFLGAADPDQLLPIRSPNLSPGVVPRRTLDRRYAHPFFLIGSDRLSKEWLARHGKRLREIGAVGMLVQAESIDDLRAIAELADGLRIFPASGSDIGEALHLSHYPVLISRFGIDQ